ncbi:MAG: hypothetical protein JNM93_03565 [Bacteriovoracaceae bacterium]|nr:hypothetical protein [Bacteriovoracaceae bacterium]
MSSFLFYLGLSMQLFGFAAVGLCLFAGLQTGDYGRIELAQFILGIFLFYTGTYFKNRTSK